MGKCEICGKPTWSHEVVGKAVCHSCWESREEEVERLKERAKEEEARRERIENSGTEMSVRLDDTVDSKKELYNVIDEYQKRLNQSLEVDPRGEIFHEIERKVSRKLAFHLFQFTKEEGWPFILNLVEKWDPEDESVVDNFPFENVVGRMIILTRTEEGVERIPAEALEYLVQFREASGMEWEESLSCGWAFDHPDFEFIEVVEEEVKKGNVHWVSGALERAFYADQEGVAPILIDLIKREDLSLQDKIYLIQAVTFSTGDRWNRFPPSVPRDWNWKEAIDYGKFEWDEEVKSGLKRAIEEEIAEDFEDFSRGRTEKERFLRPLPDCDFSGEWSLTDLCV